MILNQTLLFRKRFATFLVLILKPWIVSSWCTVSTINLPAVGTASATINGVENGFQRSIPILLSRSTGTTIWTCRFLRLLRSIKLLKTSCLSWMDPEAFTVPRRPTTRARLKISAAWIQDCLYSSSVGALQAWLLRGYLGLASYTHGHHSADSE